MLTIRRGAPVEILTSSADDRRHPKTGDKGFLSNAFLCPKLHMIISDIYFFRFGNERESRCERKTFIIDAGMSKDTQRRIRNGLKREDFTRLMADYINLTPAFVRLVSGIIDYMPTPFSNVGIFRGQIRRPVSNSLNAIVKIPFGTLKSLPGYQTISDYNTALALFKAVRPVLHHLVRDADLVEARPVRPNNMVCSVSKMLEREFFYASVPDVWGARTYIYNPINGLPTEKLLEKTRQIQSVAVVALYKSINKVLNEILTQYPLLISEYGNYIAERFASCGVAGWFHDDTRKLQPSIFSVEKVLGSILYLLLFAEPVLENIDRAYRTIQNSSILFPPMTRSFSPEKSLRKIIAIRKEGANSSAALARLLGAEPFF